MKKPDITGLELLNWILQIFCIRIYKRVNEGVVTHWGLMYWVVPFTGWYSNYKSLNKTIKFRDILKV